MRPAVAALAGDLQRIFGARIKSLVAYGHLDHDESGTHGASTIHPGRDEDDGLHTLALVEGLTFQDLAACAPLVRGWRKAGLAVPLLLSRDEFLRTLDVFPIEYGAIMDRHLVILGVNPFAGMSVAAADLRRACEHQLKSHLVHLREGYLESGAEPAALGRLIGASGPALSALAAHLERLDPGIDERAGLTPELIREVAAAGTSTIADPSALFARYLGVVERLWEQVDRWRR
jgi:hypothetical protein